jgi:transposase, IS5 family
MRVQRHQIHACPTMPLMTQRSFASAEFACKKKRTRRERFLADMERVVPWDRLIAVVQPLYPTSGRVGRQPMGVPKMLRMYLLQQWYGLADEALEDAIYDSQALRDFVGIDLSRESVPDATTLLKFRRLLVGNDLTKALFEEINAHLAQQGLLMRAGTIVDATIIAAPSSTKNQKGERDPDMHQTQKGNQWHMTEGHPHGWGMKAHIGVDAQSGVVHSVISTAANVNDVTQAGALLHGEEADAFGDAGYQGVHKRQEAQGPNWHVAMRPGKRKALSDSTLGQMIERREKILASIRARVEHPFHVVKNLFKHKKARYQGLAKNHAQLLSLFGLANLVIAKRRLLAMQGMGAS